MNADSTPAEGPERTWRIAGLLCAVALLWLATRPYLGVVLDARFYMLEALSALDPARFAEDLYFKFGSQGSFSVFTWLYRPLLPLFGVGLTAIILTIAGQLLWLFGLLRLTHALVGPRFMWLSAAAVIGMINVYAGGFGYGESYLTARLYSEALVMLALSQLAVRPQWAWGLLAVAAALHPLMALPGIGVAFLYLAVGQPVWWAVMAAGAAMIAGLGLMGVEPFSNLFRTIDPEWFAVLQVRELHCLLTTWPKGDFVQVGGVLAWAVAGLFLVGREHRRLLAAVLVVGVGGLVCTYLGGDIVRNVLVVELQPWRSMWLLQLFARIYIPLVFAAILARTSFHVFGWSTFLAMGVILVSCVTRLVRLPGSAEFSFVSLALVTAGLAVMAGHLLLTDQRYRRVTRFSAAACLALLLTAVARWDSRTPWSRFMEALEPPPGDLATLLPEEASVYWENNSETLWLRFRRPAYFSCSQGTGAVFYRDTAMTYRRRSESFWPLRTSDFGSSDACASFDARPRKERNSLGLQKLCRREPRLDYLVLGEPLDGVTAKVWKSPAIYQDIRMSDGKATARLITDRFYIYSCADVR